MATIPKYVYVDLKNKASGKLSEAKANAYGHYKQELQNIGDKVLNKEKEKFAIKSEYIAKMDRHYNHNIGEYEKRFSGTVKVEVDYDHSKVKDKIEKAQQVIINKIQKIHDDLDAEFETWQINLFIKASEGQTLAVPSFDIDYSKY